MNLVLLMSCSVVTLVFYVISRKVASKYPSPLTTPNFICTIALIVLFLLAGVSVEEYEPTKEILTFLLGPATVALALPIYRNRNVFLRYYKAISIGLIAGTLSSMLSAICILSIFKVSDMMVASISVKSVTVPIALEISKVIGGDEALTTAFVIFTGISGAMLGPVFLNMFKVNNPVSRGLALGTLSHGVGTAQATQESELTGAVSGVAMGLTAIVTSFIAPFLF